MDFEAVVKNRHSIRAFLQKEIEEEKLKKILELANLAPSAGNLQAYEIFVVKDKVKKEKLAFAAYSQDFIKEAPIVLVFCANPSRSEIKYGERGRDLYCIQDATIACTFAMLAATSLGLGCCWVGAFDEEMVKSILKVKNLKPIAILPIGYPAEKPYITKRRDLNDIVHKI
ncbi:MAG: nitroreductase family protein [Candidatus Aenigmatarchaeota archaeon]